MLANQFESKDSDDSVVSIKPELKMVCWPGNLSQKGAKTCPHYDVTTRNLKPKSKTFF